MSDINFSKLTWENLPARTTALSATNLNRIEKGIDDSVNGVNSNSHSIAELQTRISQMSGGVPPTASSTSGMNPEVSTVYINTTDGNWYYYDGSAWTSGGTYGGTAVTDTTLSISGAAADAKAVGDAISETNGRLTQQGTSIGDLSQLNTEEKTNLVAAINEAAQVDDTLTISGAAADAKATADALTALSADLDENISDLKSAFDNFFTPENLAENATYTGYYYVNYTDGTNKAGNSYKASSMIDISGCTKIMYDRLYTANSLSYAGIAFYDENQEFIPNHGIPSVFRQPSEEYKLEAADVPTGAKYVRITGFRQLATVMRVYNYNVYMATVPAQLKEHESELTQLGTDMISTNLRIDNIGKKTPITDLMVFIRGCWNSVNSFKTTTSYRVGCSTAITFSKTVYLCALNGFGLCGYLGGVFFTTRGALTVPANTELKLYVRRVWEDTSETADVDAFTNGIYILNYNPSSEYDLNLDTFAGIEMFRTAGFIGDSYTATRLGYGWVDILQNITGVQCTKFAKSGADSGAWRSATTYGLPALLNDTPKDLYWMALGVNDGDRVDSNSSYLGSVADLTGSYADYPDTFWGNTGCIIESIKAFAPSAKIVLFKPIFTSVLRTLAGQSATQNGIKLVRDAIGEIGQHYSLPVMDALDDVLYQSPWFTASLDYAVSAGTHPSLVLYPAIAKANMRLMSKCIQANSAYFLNLRYD